MHELAAQTSLVGVLALPKFLNPQVRTDDTTKSKWRFGLIQRKAEPVSSSFSHISKGFDAVIPVLHHCVV